MTVSIRPFHPADAAVCGEIVARSALWQRYGVDAAQAARQVADAAQAGEHVHVAEADGTIVGFAWVTPRGAFGRSDYLRRIAVEEPRRGLGVGSALLAAVENAARADGRDVVLLVSDFNDRAQRFYRAHGYQQVGTLPRYVLPDVDELILWKRIPG